MTFAEPDRIELCNCCAFPKEGAIADFEICPCCGFQKAADGIVELGDDPISKYSQRWILGGMRWWSESRVPPTGWNPEKYQLPWLMDAYGKDWVE